MTIEEATKKAIEGGFWDYFELLPLERAECRLDGKTKTVIATGDGLIVGRQLEELLLDPSFWQSLGKALGWRDYSNADLCRECVTKYSPMSGWRAYWHRFIDHLADGKSAELFFESIQ